MQLVKINKGLAVVIGGVGEIVAKTAPVNGVLDAINGNLVAGRNLLENLFIKKAGDDAGGLVESLFPGEGAKFLQRVGRRGPVINTGIVYTRGTVDPRVARSRRPDRCRSRQGPGSARPEVRHDRGGDAVPAAWWRPARAAEVSGRGLELAAPVRGVGDAGRAPAQSRRVGGSASVRRRRTCRPVGSRSVSRAPRAPTAVCAAAATLRAAPGRLNVKGARPWER